MNAEARTHFRKRLQDLSSQELTQWLFLVNLAVKVEAELLAFQVLFDPEAEPETDPGTDELSGIQLLIASEIKRRSVAKAKRQLVQIGEQHANHEQNNGSD